MKNIFGIAIIVTTLLAIYFGGVAYAQYTDEKMDEVFLNIGYCALFLSCAVYAWHLREEKQNNN